jgi:hypothetical protein
MQAQASITTRKLTLTYFISSSIANGAITYKTVCNNYYRDLDCGSIEDREFLPIEKTTAVFLGVLYGPLRGVPRLIETTYSKIKENQLHEKGYNINKEKSIYYSLLSPAFDSTSNL